MRADADFGEKMKILSGILFPDLPGAEKEPETEMDFFRPAGRQAEAKEVLGIFYAFFTGHRNFLKGQYEILLPGEADLSEGILRIAREQQGVCGYGLDLSSGKVMYLDPAGSAVPLEISLEDLLLALTALQSMGSRSCCGMIADCRDLLKKQYSGRRITETTEEGAVYCFEEGVVLAVSGKDAFVSAGADSAMEAFERRQGLEVDYF